jgi:tRNA nucleotidyltransferase (CCA-adding enzyme)
MAYSPVRGYIDPFGGQADLQRKILRTVGDPTARFTEDALRILRGVRFGVRFDLTVDDATLQAMNALAPQMDKLARERVFDELCKLLPLVKARDLLTYRHILAQVVPPLAPCIDFLQHNPHHLYDVYTHTAQVVEAVPADLALRWAALLHDCGKPQCFRLDENGIGHFYGHAQISAELAERLLFSLKAPTVLREQVVFLIDHHMTQWEPDKKLLRRRLGKYGVQGFFDLLALEKADCGADSSADFETIEVLAREILSEEACLTVKDLAIDGCDLLSLGFPAGKALGACLSYLLEKVQDEEVSNDRSPLLDAAKLFLQNKTDR